MTYRAAYDLFQTKFEREISKVTYVKGKPVKHEREKMGIREVMSLFGEVQKKVGDLYNLWERYTTIDLIEGQYIYSESDPLASRLPEDLLEISEIKLNDTYKTPLDRLDKQSVPRPVITSVSSRHIVDPVLVDGRLKGLPKGYTIYLTNSERKLELDSIPDQSYSSTYTSYRLLVWYKARLDLFDPAAGNDTWSDYDEDEDDLGGEFKIPKNWDLVIIYGALADIFPSYYSMYADYLKELGVIEPDYFTNTLPSYLGKS